MSDQITRRGMMKTAATVGVAAALGSGNLALAEESSADKAVKNGRINQSVCQWCFKAWDQETFWRFCA